jgi:hypothetical protein
MMVKMAEDISGLATTATPASKVKTPIRKTRTPLPRLPAWKAQIMRMIPAAMTSMPTISRID